MLTRTLLTAAVAIALAFAAPARAADDHPRVPLWPHDAPGSEGVHIPDNVQPSGVTGVHQPTIEVWLPPKEKANGTGVIVAPGGGNRVLVERPEGTRIAKWFNDRGVAAFVLRYRLQYTPGYHYRRDRETFWDGQRALRLVRSRAAEWNVDPHKIGFIGFSAGGELAARVEMHYDAGNASAQDPVERVSSRPDWVVLVYPGWEPMELSIQKDAAPAFLVCAGDDEFHARETVQFWQVLFDAKIPAEMHIYERGGHAGAISPRGGIPFGTWEHRMVDWLADHKLMAPDVSSAASGVPAFQTNHRF